MSQQLKRLYTFGDFRLDCVSSLLIHKDQPVPLTPKVFDTLVLLVENAGRLVDKDEFMHRLWPDTFVGDDALTRNIYVLRKVLEETANGQEYIATVPKRGYRFVARVEEMVSTGQDAGARAGAEASQVRGELKSPETTHAKPAELGVEVDKTVAIQPARGLRRQIHFF